MQTFIPTKKTAFGSVVVLGLLAALFGRYVQKEKKEEVFACEEQKYMTEIVSVDPLVIYINDFVSQSEAEKLISLGEPHFAISEVFLGGIKRPTKDRTSLSAGLPLSAPLVQCVGYRAREFMGTLLEFTDDLDTPQIVRYEKGQKFNLHHDWYNSPQMLQDGTRRWFNRLGSFFVYLEANDVEEGETWFPHLKYKYDGLGVRCGRGEKWISGGEEGGVKFVPRKGSAIFWMNLHTNGTGDGRVMHAGLPLKAGRKTAMNIWPRQFVEMK